MSYCRSRHTGSANNGPIRQKPAVRCATPDTGIVAKPYSTGLQPESVPALKSETLDSPKLAKIILSI